MLMLFLLHAGPLMMEWKDIHVCYVSVHLRVLYIVLKIVAV